MSIYAAVDSNALTYLVNAIGVEGYNPANDSSGLANERVAMSRLFMYGDCRLWVPPAVRIETEDIPPGQLRDAQNRTTWYQLLDHDSGVPESVIEQRVKELLPHHAGISDCRVVAETEAMELGYLIMRDDKLQKRLQRSHKGADRATDRTVGIPRYRLCAPVRNGPGAGQSVERLRLVASPGLLMVGLPFRRRPPSHSG
jgi:hypothetical protein